MRYIVIIISWLYDISLKRRDSVVETREELEREAFAQFRQMMHRFKANCAHVWMSIDLTVPQLRTLFVLAE